MVQLVLYTVWYGYNTENIDVLMQERRNSIANALELHLSCTNPSIFLPNTHNRDPKVMECIL